MIFIEHTTDFEFYSSTSKGAVQGYGYVFHAAETYGPRILRLYEVANFSIHDIALVDAGAFHFVMDTCSNGEVYNMIIRGSNEGGLDGIDVWGTNNWIHDIEVTNKDECIIVKSPASYILIKSIYCNCSGGCAIGSLGVDTDIHDIEYNHIYTQESNQMLMVNSNAGSGFVYSCSFNKLHGTLQRIHARHRRVLELRNNCSRRRSHIRSLARHMFQRHNPGPSSISVLIWSTML